MRLFLLPRGYIFCRDSCSPPYLFVSSNRDYNYDKPRNDNFSGLDNSTLLRTPGQVTEPRYSPKIFNTANKITSAGVEQAPTQEVRRG